MDDLFVMFKFVGWALKNIDIIYMIAGVVMMFSGIIGFGILSIIVGGAIRALRIFLKKRREQ